MSSTASDIKDLATAGGIVVGGLWAYLKVVKGRTFGYRAELSSASEVEWSDDGYRIKVRAVLSNTGSSKIPLDHELRIVELQMVDRLDSGRVATWTDVLTAPIFSEHDWVEPGERVSDDILALVARGGAVAEQLAVRVRVRVVARRRKAHRYPAGWESNEVIVLSGLHPVNEAPPERGGGSRGRTDGLRRKEAERHGTQGDPGPARR